MINSLQDESEQENAVCSYLMANESLTRVTYLLVKDPFY